MGKFDQIFNLTPILLRIFTEPSTDKRAQSHCFGNLRDMLITLGSREGANPVEARGKERHPMFDLATRKFVPRFLPARVGTKGNTVHFFREQLLQPRIQIQFLRASRILPNQIMVFSGSLTHVTPCVF